MPSIAAEVYPLAHTQVPVVRDLGIVGDYARAVGLRSTDAGGTRVGTSWQGFDVGLRQRLSLTHALLLGVNVGYGGIDFQFASTPTPTAQLPGVRYRFLRAGVDLRGSLGPISIFGGGGYLGMLSSGDASAFPHESLGGVEARLGLAYSPAQSFEVSLGVTYTRIFYRYDPTPGDANVAGGALDQMANVSFAVAYVL
jgi:hypothetical protein